MQTSDMEYTYFAFISYQHNDEKQAEWLQNELESYGFPVSVRKANPGLPAKISPIFRDETELSGGLLKAEIEKALFESKYLIVICSPRSAQSPWVKKEIEYFISLGREKQIIPFIIDGEPNATNPAEECYPEPLRQLTGEKELLGINIDEMGREAAAIKVVARMFGLRFDTLWQRHERAKRRRRLAVIIGLLAFALISFAVALIMLNLKQQADTNAQIAQNETERANKEKDNALKAKEALELANDSIRLQSSKIAQSLRDIEEANRNLTTERDNVKRANWKMMENRALIVAEKANELIDEGDSYTALALCLEVFPKNLENPEIPYLAEVERTLRRAISQRFSGKYYGHGNGFTGIEKIIIRPTHNQIITYGYDKTLQIWDAETATPIKTLYDERVWSMPLSPNGKYFAGEGTNGEVVIYDLDNFSNYIIIKPDSYEPEGGIDDLYFTSYNALALILQNGDIQFLDPDTGLETRRIVDPIGKNIDVKVFVSPDGRYLASYYDKTLTIWDSEYNKMGDYKADFSIEEIKFSPTGKYLAIEFHRYFKVILLDAKTMEIKKTFNGITALCFDGDNKIILANEDGLISHIINQNTTKTENYLNNMLKGREITQMEIGGKDGSDSWLVLTTNRGDVFVNRLHPFEANINRFATDDTYQLISTGLDFPKEERLTRIKLSMNKKKIAMLTSQYNEPNTIRKLFVGDINGTEIKSVKYRRPTISGQFYLSSDGNLLAYDHKKMKKDKKLIVVINPKSDEIINMFQAYKYTNIAFSFDNKLIAYEDKNNNTIIKSVRTGETIQELFDDDVNCFSPNGKYLASKSHIWDVNTGERIKEYISLPVGPVFSPDSKYIYLANNNILEKRDIETWSCEKRYVTPYQNLDYIDFSEDGKFLLIYTDKILSVWNLKTEECVYNKEIGFVIGLPPTFSGSYIIWDNRDGLVGIEFPRTENLLERVNERNGHKMKVKTLTPEERRRYLLD